MELVDWERGGVDLIVIREWPRAADAGDPGEQGRPLELTSWPGPNLASHSYVAPVSKLMTMKLMKKGDIINKHKINSKL